MPTCFINKRGHFYYYLFKIPRCFNHLKYLISYFFFRNFWKFTYFKSKIMLWKVDELSKNVFKILIVLFFRGFSFFENGFSPTASCSVTQRVEGPESRQRHQDSHPDGGNLNKMHPFGTQNGCTFQILMRLFFRPPCTTNRLCPRWTWMLSISFSSRFSY